jgi:hypothetical protein
MKAMASPAGFPGGRKTVIFPEEGGIYCWFIFRHGYLRGWQFIKIGVIR